MEHLENFKANIGHREEVEEYRREYPGKSCALRAEEEIASSRKIKERI